MCSPRAEIDGRRRISKRGGGGICGWRRRFPWPVALWRSAGFGNWRRRSGSASRTSWRPRLSPVGSMAGGSRTAGGGPAAPGGARLQRAAHSKERRGVRLGLKGKVAGVLRSEAGRGRAGHGRDGRRRRAGQPRRPRPLAGWMGPTGLGGWAGAGWVGPRDRPNLVG
jgi:hypothetical protein